MCSARSAVVAALDMVHIVAHRGAVRPAPGPPAPCDVGRCSATVEAMADGALPDFNIPLDEKLEWMIQTKGYAVEPVPARTDTDPPLAGYIHTIGFPEAFAFPDVVVFGLSPVAA